MSSGSAGGERRGLREGLATRGSRVAKELLRPVSGWSYQICSVGREWDTLDRSWCWGSQHSTAARCHITFKIHFSMCPFLTYSILPFFILSSSPRGSKAQWELCSADAEWELCWLLFVITTAKEIPSFTECHSVRIRDFLPVAQLDWAQLRLTRGGSAAVAGLQMTACYILVRLFVLPEPGEVCRVFLGWCCLWRAGSKGFPGVCLAGNHYSHAGKLGVHGLWVQIKLITPLSHVLFSIFCLWR